ncbi:MAG: hypothetical protein JWO62_2682 [Acidimicrobiaceae bacterium]|nr:hypothetical protein [Acidimicrobiaceae bacterium]
MEVTPYPKPPQRKTRRPRPIRAFSEKRAAGAEARRECVAAVVARDGRCMFFPLLSEYMQITPADLVKYAGLPRCDRRELTAHEPAHSRNVGRLNPDTSLAMCWEHNGWLEDCTGIWREHAYACGLLVHGNGLPLRKSYPLSHVAGAFSQAESDRGAS